MRVSWVIVGLAILIAAVHSAGLLWLGTSPAGSLFSNSMQVAASGLAVVACHVAARRRTGYTRKFWNLMSAGYLLWTIGQVIFLYYENVLHREIPPLSPTDIPYFASFLPMVAALILQPEDEAASRGVDWVRTLDFAQVAIVASAVYLYFFFYLGGTVEQRMLLFSLGVGNLYDIISVLLAAGFLLRAAFATNPTQRTLLGRIGAVIFVYALGEVAYTYGLVAERIQTGTWYDLSYSVPYALAAVVAATWKPQTEGLHAAFAEGESRLRAMLPTLAPMVVLATALGIAGRQIVLAMTIVTASFICYSARLAITQYRQRLALGMLRQAEAKFRTLFQHHPQPMWLYDPHTLRFLEANAAAVERYGYTRDEYLNMKITDLRPPEDVPKLMEWLKKPEEQRTRLQARHRRRDGSTLDVDVYAQTVDFGGRRARLVMAQDVTERLRAEDSLRAAEARYRTLVEQLAAITYVTEMGPDARWHYVSPQIESLLGITPEEWLADPTMFGRQCHPEDLGTVRAAERKAMETGRFEGEYRMFTRDGRTLWFRDTGMVVRDASGRPTLHGLMVDVTEAKLLEAQLRQAQKMEAVGTLAGGIAHDFNNLLTVIQGYGQLLGERLKDNAELAAEVKQIEDAAQRAAALTRQLLAFSRRQVLKPKVLDLNSVVTGMNRMLRRVIGEDIELVTRTAPDLSQVQADPGQIEQVIMNLAVNARDAMPEGGKLIFETRNVELDAAYTREHVGARPGQYVMLAVTDTGVGMDAQTQAHIFEPFFTTKELGRGTGLGLSTVYGIVKQSGGYIEVHSEPGHGSTFKIYLPRAGQAAAGAGAEPRTQPRARGTETILLLEDDHGLRELAVRVLRSSGYTVLEAGNGEQAERVCREHSGDIHLLLTDVVMPGQSGPEVARRLSPVRPAMKVLYISGYAPNAIVEQGTLGPGAAFLHKPFTPSALLEKVQQVLESQGATAV
ncbi:MAG TPA: PAS domain S-box protein [Terriglobales bacterium]|nr:PAS domain S-box protein [Terriglobales bacterium]